MTVKQSNIVKIHWNRITPGRLLVVILVVEMGLFFSEHWYPKGWAVLIATIIVVAATLYVLIRLALASKFHMPFQYSIRSMMIFTAIIALAGGWMAQRIRDAVKQRQALGLEGRFYRAATDSPSVNVPNCSAIWAWKITCNSRSPNSSRIAGISCFSTACRYS